MVDLCVGPHIPHTGKIKAFMVTKVSVRGVLSFRTRSKLYLLELRFIFPW